MTESDAELIPVRPWLYEVPALTISSEPDKDGERASAAPADRENRQTARSESEKVEQPKEGFELNMVGLVNINGVVPGIGRVIASHIGDHSDAGNLRIIVRRVEPDVRVSLAAALAGSDLTLRTERRNLGNAIVIKALINSFEFDGARCEVACQIVSMKTEAIEILLKHDAETERSSDAPDAQYRNMVYALKQAAVNLSVGKELIGSTPVAIDQYLFARTQTGISICDMKRANEWTAPPASLTDMPDTPPRK